MAFSRLCNKSKGFSALLTGLTISSCFFSLMIPENSQSSWCRKPKGDRDSAPTQVFCRSRDLLRRTCGGCSELKRRCMFVLAQSVKTSLLEGICLKFAVTFTVFFDISSRAERNRDLDLMESQTIGICRLRQRQNPALDVPPQR